MRSRSTTKWELVSVNLHPKTPFENVGCKNMRRCGIIGGRLLAAQVSGRQLMQDGLVGELRDKRRATFVKPCWHHHQHHQKGPTVCYWVVHLTLDRTCTPPQTRTLSPAEFSTTTTTRILAHRKFSEIVSLVLLLLLGFVSYILSFAGILVQILSVLCTVGIGAQEQEQGHSESFGTPAVKLCLLWVFWVCTGSVLHASSNIKRGWQAAAPWDCLLSAPHTFVSHRPLSVICLTLSVSILW